MCSLRDLCEPRFDDESECTEFVADVVNFEGLPSVAMMKPRGYCEERTLHDVRMPFLAVNLWTESVHAYLAT